MRKVIILLLILAPAAFAQNYRIDWYVIGSGGGHSSSGSYQVDGTIGQPIVGQSSSPNYRVEAGFWVGAPVSGPGCDYMVGDINGNHATNGIDVTYGVSYFKGGSAPIDSCDCRPAVPTFPFYGAGDVNGNCAFNGIDITYFVSYLKGGPALHFCIDCPPAGLAPPAPAVMPRIAPSAKADAKAGSRQ